MKKSQVLFFLILCSTAVNAAIITGPIDWAVNGHSYYLLSCNTWKASQQEAESLGGHLVTINDQVESDWVFNTFATGAGSGRGLWIGYRRLEKGGPFSWVSGESTNFTNWARYEPNFADEKYTLILPEYHNHSASGKWNNYYNSSTSTYGSSIPTFSIYGVVEVPEPCSLMLITLGCLLIRKH